MFVGLLRGAYQSKSSGASFTRMSSMISPVSESVVIRRVTIFQSGPPVLVTRNLLAFMAFMSVRAHFTRFYRWGFRIGCSRVSVPARPRCRQSCLPTEAWGSANAMRRRLLDIWKIVNNVVTDDPSGGGDHDRALARRPITSTTLF